MEIGVRAKELSDSIVSWRRELHKIPEISLNLPQTSAYVAKTLEQMGISYRTFENHSGIVATIGEGTGSVVALRADMDGLQVQEDVEVDYKSINENMHSCGHDAHMAILLGAAQILKEQSAKLNGKIKLIFQPGEEDLSGAKLMVKDGVLENPNVNYMLALHTGSMGGKYKLGDIVIGYQDLFASSEAFCIDVKGKGGHASTPHLTIDPIVITAQIINELQTLVSREVKPGTPAVVSLTSLTAGRGTINIIPDSAQLLGGIRTNNSEMRDYLRNRVEEIARGIATVHHAESTFKILLGCPPLLNDKDTVRRFVQSAKKIMPEEEIHEMSELNMGAEDASYFFQEVPGCYFFLCNHQPADDGKAYPHHNAKFCIDDSVLHRGTALLTQAAIDLMNQK